MNGQHECYHQILCNEEPDQMKELEGADFDHLEGENFPAIRIASWRCDCPDLRLFKIQLSDPHQGKEGIHAVREKLDQLVPLWLSNSMSPRYFTL